MKKSRCFVTILLLITVKYIAFSQNPFIKNQFTDDPTERVFNDRVYVFASHDIICSIVPERRWFSIEDYQVFSSENLVDWIDHDVIDTQYEALWVRDDSYVMLAPHAIEKEGKYYFYFPASVKSEFGIGSMIGVAIVDNPEGPYTLMNKSIAGVNGFDPCPFIDKDGQTYQNWSGRGMWLAILRPNMIELDCEPRQAQGLPEGRGLKEGTFFFARNGIYNYTYPWVKKNNTIELLYYSIYDNLYSPFRDGNAYMVELPSQCWTNHHSFIEYMNQWHLSYHQNDYLTDFDKNRSIRIDSVRFNPDRTIQKVIPTFQGVEITDARREIQINRYTSIAANTGSITFLNPTKIFEEWKTIFSK